MEIRNQYWKWFVKKIKNTRFFFDFLYKSFLLLVCFLLFNLLKACVSTHLYLCFIKVIVLELLSVCFYITATYHLSSNFSCICVFLAFVVCA